LEAEAGLSESNAEAIAIWIRSFYDKGSETVKANNRRFYAAVMVPLLAVITFFLKWFVLGGSVTAATSSSLAGLLVFVFNFAVNQRNVNSAVLTALEAQPLVWHYFVLLCVVIGLFVVLAIVSITYFILFYVRLFKNRFDTEAGSKCAFLAAVLGALALASRIAFVLVVEPQTAVSAGEGSFFMITPVPLATLFFGLAAMALIGKYNEGDHRSDMSIVLEKPEMKNTTFVVLSLIILTLPATLLAAYGEPGQTFAGEADYQRPVYSVGAFLSGSFQDDYDNWFSTKYPQRAAMVEAYGALEAWTDTISLDFRQGEAAAEEQGYRGNDQVVVGKEGYLYENGYINEYFGFARRYADTTDEQLEARVAVLRAIQEKLARAGVAFCVVITPSKAAFLPQYIPEWYLAKHIVAPEYVRPYHRFTEMLAREGVFFIDSASVYKETGLVEIFPKTGTHWTKLAAFDTTVAIIKEYERQKGSKTRSIAYDMVWQSSAPPGFGTSEQDIFGVAYAGRSNEEANAIIDSAYFYPDVYATYENEPAIPHMILQGGSFNDDIIYYLSEYSIASSITEFRYNNSEDTDIDWETLIGQTDFVVLETNEQFVYNMGGSAPAWGISDFLASEPGENIIDSLYKYLHEVD
jgi:hypothetical protein